jgi:undecaprenyl-diphosphatase
VNTVYLADAVVFAALQGVTTLLPISASGHQFVARIWLGTPRGLTALQALADLGCLLAMVVVVRRRLGLACLEGIRGLLRPAVIQSSAGGRDALAILVASLVAGATELLVRPQLTSVNEMPLVAGAGLLLTGISLASTAFAPPPRQVAPGALGALLVGLAHGLAMVPGMSRIGAAYVALRWLGIGSWRAAEVAMMVSVPVMALQGARLAFVHPDFAALGSAQLALTVVLAFVTASLAASWWKGLCERRESAWLSLWVLPLGLAVLAYGRALPDPQSSQRQRENECAISTACRTRLTRSSWQAALERDSGLLRASIVPSSSWRSPARKCSCARPSIASCRSAGWSGSISRRDNTWSTPHSRRFRISSTRTC